MHRFEPERAAAERVVRPLVVCGLLRLLVRRAGILQVGRRPAFYLRRRGPA